MNAEELVLRVRADGRGVKETFAGISRESDSLELSTRKASTTMRTFVYDLSQARTGADVASAALSAFSKILGTTLAGTAVVMAGKVVIDAFQKVSENVNKAKDSIASAREEIAKMGAVTGLADGAAQANLLYKAASDAEKAIKEIEKSKLQNFIAEVRGAKDELKGMASEAKKTADALKTEAIQREAAQIQIERNLTEEDKLARKISERYEPLIKAAQEIGDQSLTESLRLSAQQERIDALAKYRKGLEEKQKEADLKTAQELAESAYKQIDAEFQLQYKNNEALAKQQEKNEEERQRKIKETEATRKALEKESLDMAIKRLALEERLSEVRQRVVEAEGEVARISAGFGGTGRGAGNRPTSFEIGAQRAAERAFRDEQRRQTLNERQRIRDEMELALGSAYDPDTGKLVRGQAVSGFDVQRELSKRISEAARQRAGGPFQQAQQARQMAQATEATLQSVKDNLKSVLDELKTYAHAA